jgi:protein translocase SEC61 complex gamma subunit
MTHIEDVQKQATYQTEKAKKQFLTLFNDLYQLFNRANKPSKKAYFETTKIILLGVIVMGMVGFMVKIASIPINNILIGGQGE